MGRPDSDSPGDVRILLVLIAAVALSLPARAVASGDNTKTRSSLVSKRKRVVAAARRYLGVRYVFGGTGRYGIDCSGLALAAYRAIGVSLPHHAATQERYGRPVRGRLLPGDLVFFDYGGHVGVYAGAGVMVEASSARGRVIYQRLATYGLHFDGARRLIR